MTALTLLSSHQRPLKPLVEAALENELRLLQAGIAHTEQRIRAFEAQYGLLSEDFLRRYENDELEESLDFAEWVGECHLQERVREQIRSRILSTPQTCGGPTDYPL
jgi:hypothetical protein